MKEAWNVGRYHLECKCDLYMQKSVKVTMKSTRKCDLFYQARNNDLPVTHLNINPVVKLMGRPK